MTDTTSIDQIIRERRVYVPTLRPQPGVATLISQAVVGGFFGSFLAGLVWLLLHYELNNGLFVYSLPLMLAFGLATGLPAGLLMWACSRLANGSLHIVNRFVIAVLVVAAGWFCTWLLWMKKAPSPETLLWVAEAILVTGITMSLVTGSRLRLWRELVRHGEASGTVLRILAGLTGIILRVLIVFFLLSSLIVLISTFQTAYRLSEYPQSTLVWVVLVFGHFALGVVVLFVRMRFPVLAFLTAIASMPPVASFWLVPNWAPETRYIFVGYLCLWAVFLLTRWRQTQVAFSVLKEEFRYYLID